LEPSLIHYSLDLASLDRHTFVIECRIENPLPEHKFTMPSWIPGSYLLREFARHVVAIEAFSGGRPVAVSKVGKGSWLCTGARESLVLRATVFAHDQSVRGAYLDRERAFFNGTSVFLVPEGRESDPVVLNLAVPAHPACDNWKVATAMQATEMDERGFGTYQAENYDELIDHPFEISAHRKAGFEAAGVPHSLVVAGRFDSDLERVVTDLSQLCEAQIEFFGRPAPFDSYTFLGLAVGNGYGGLEHRASSSLIFCRDDLPKVAEQSIPRNYQRFLALCSHEYFHSWHVKRSKPAAFMPYRLDRRNHTRQLWVFEGITTYYQERFLLTSGLLGSSAYLRRLGEQLTRVYRVPGRFSQSLEQSSFDAWDSLYKPGPNSVNAGVSYYSKGGLVALALDLTLRRSTAGSTTLDDIVRELWRRYGAQQIGVPEDGFETIAAEIAGEPLGEFFDTAARGTDDLDLAGLFASFGLRFELRPSRGLIDSGGTPAVAGEQELGIGATIASRPNGVGLETVLDDGPASAAGLSPGDILVAIDGFVVDEKNFLTRVGRYSAGDRARVDFMRDQQLRFTELELSVRPNDTCSIEFDADAAASAIAMRSAWLCE
jgi:predicted metalloprotease with PDZ domain